MLLLSQTTEYTEDIKGTAMETFGNTNTETYAPDTQPRVIEYATLTDTLQVSLARQLHVPGAIEAHTFEEVLSPFDEEERHRITCEVGARFDDEVLYYVTCVLIARRNRTITIVAEASEGFDGYLPWQKKLEQYLAAKQNEGILTDARVTVERYTEPTDIRTITALGEISLHHVTT